MRLTNINAIYTINELMIGRVKLIYFNKRIENKNNIIQVFN